MTHCAFSIILVVFVVVSRLYLCSYLPMHWRIKILVYKLGNAEGNLVSGRQIMKYLGNVCTYR